MTRKDYIAIAAALKSVRDTYPTQGTAVGSEAQHVIDDVAQHIAFVLQADNCRFDANRFFIACGSP